MPTWTSSPRLPIDTTQACVEDTHCGGCTVAVTKMCTQWRFAGPVFAFRSLPTGPALLHRARARSREAARPQCLLLFSLRQRGPAHAPWCTPRRRRGQLLLDGLHFADIATRLLAARPATQRRHRRHSRQRRSAATKACGIPPRRWLRMTPAQTSSLTCSKSAWGCARERAARVGGVCSHPCT